MADLTVDNLKTKLEALKRQREQLNANICAVDGAIQLCNALIEEAEKPVESKPDGDHA